MSNIRWFKPGRLPRYPHQGAFSAQLFNRFWDNCPWHVVSVAYDVPVGNGRDTLPGTSPELQKDWTYLSSLKIDMLLELSTSYIICEIKDLLNPELVGQLQIYSHLLDPSFRNAKPIELCAIASAAHPDVMQYCQSHNITVLIYPLQYVTTSTT